MKNHNLDDINLHAVQYDADTHYKIVISLNQIL